MLALPLARPGAKVLSLEPGFVMYRMIARFAGMDYVGVPLGAEDFALDLDGALAAIERERPALTFIAYPNNPTGNLFDAASIERIIAQAPGLVILDEAYAPFTDESFLPRLGDWPNLLVMRTVSKMGLAGLRLGYLAGPDEWLGEIDKVRLPYNINVLTQASAAFALANKAVLDEQTLAIRAERARLFEALSELPGVEPFPSQANFILLRLSAATASETFAGIKQRGVLVKNLDGAHPLLRDCLRVTVGTPFETDAFLAALSDTLGVTTANGGLGAPRKPQAQRAGERFFTASRGLTNTQNFRNACKSCTSAVSGQKCLDIKIEESIGIPSVLRDLWKLHQQVPCVGAQRRSIFLEVHRVVEVIAHRVCTRQEDRLQPILIKPI